MTKLPYISKRLLAQRLPGSLKILIMYSSTREGGSAESCNHDQTTSVQKEFEKDVTSLMLLKSLIGNPFKEEKLDCA